MKKTTILKSAALAACSFAAFALASCQEKGPAEKAGEKVDEALEEAKDEVDDATTN